MRRFGAGVWGFNPKAPRLPARRILWMCTIPSVIPGGQSFGEEIGESARFRKSDHPKIPRPCLMPDRPRPLRVCRAPNHIDQRERRLRTETAAHLHAGEAATKVRAALHGHHAARIRDMAPSSW